MARFDLALPRMEGGDRRSERKSQHPGCFLRNQSPQLGEGSGGPINLDLSGTGVEGEDLVFAFQDRGSEEGTCNHRRFKKVKPKDAQFAPGRTLK